VNQIDAKRKKVIDRLKAKPGLRGSIDAMCAYCIYDPDSGMGSWRQQVEGCTSKECPLFSVRTSSRGASTDTAETAA